MTNTASSFNFNPGFNTSPYLNPANFNSTYSSPQAWNFASTTPPAPSSTSSSTTNPWGTIAGRFGEYLGGRVWGSNEISLPPMLTAENVVQIDAFKSAKAWEDTRRAQNVTNWNTDILNQLERKGGYQNLVDSIKTGAARGFYDNYNNQNALETAKLNNQAVNKGFGYPLGISPYEGAPFVDGILDKTQLNRNLYAGSFINMR